MREPESSALIRSLAEWPERVTSALARVEVMRALRRMGARPAARRRAAAVLKRVGVIAIDGPVLEAACHVGPPDLRSLDALHLATALSLGDDLAVIVTYDRRLGKAAVRSKLRVVSPA